MGSSLERAESGSNLVIVACRASGQNAGDAVFHRTAPGKRQDIIKIFRTASQEQRRHRAAISVGGDGEPHARARDIQAWPWLHALWIRKPHSCAIPDQALGSFLEGDHVFVTMFPDIECDSSRLLFQKFDL
jgi:hypothetical protein